MNQRPSGYEPDELPDCSTPRHYKQLKADERTRTVNLLITSQLLCQLSHIGELVFIFYTFKTEQRASSL